jgi:hypothetical protein
MSGLRDVVLVVAGAEAFHPLTHVWLGMSGVLPLRVQVPRMTVTARVNGAAIAINALLTAGLCWWAGRW